MSKRQYRQAAMAKRGFDLNPSRHGGHAGYVLDDLTDAQRAIIDSSWDNAKSDPAAIARQEHKHLEEQQRMLRTMRGAL